MFWNVLTSILFCNFTNLQTNDGMNVNDYMNVAVYVRLFVRVDSS